MKSNVHWILKNSHLILSFSIVIPTAIVYGSPSILPMYLNINVNTVDLSNMMKANMCFYLGCSFVWILGAWKFKYYGIATQLNILFMLSLAIGRVLSLLLDGFPSASYIFGLIAEFILGFYSIFQLKKYS